MGAVPAWFLDTSDAAGTGHIGNAGVSHIVMICTETPDAALDKITIAGNPSNSIEQDGAVISGGAALVNSAQVATIAKGITTSAPLEGSFTGLPGMQYLYFTCAPDSGEADFTSGQFRILITSYNI
jgi:hypothetical protein